MKKLGKVFIFSLLFSTSISLAGPGGCLVGYAVSAIATYKGRPIDPYLACMIGDALLPFNDKGVQKYNIKDFLNNDEIFQQVIKEAQILAEKENYLKDNPDLEKYKKLAEGLTYDELILLQKKITGMGQ